MEGKKERGGEGKEVKKEREGKREERGRRRRGGGRWRGRKRGGRGKGREERGRGSRANQSPLLFFPYGGISRPSWHCRTAHRGPSRSAVDRELH